MEKEMDYRQYVFTKRNNQVSNCPDDKIVDHINGNTLDNRKINLRICTAGENNCNQRKRSDNTSGYRGVSYNKEKKRWVAYISKNGKRYSLGYFFDIEKAHVAYCIASEKYHGEFGGAQ
jgi:hypothetical protein